MYTDVPPGWTGTSTGRAGASGPPPFDAMFDGTLDGTFDGIPPASDATIPRACVASTFKFHYFPKYFDASKYRASVYV